MKKVFLTFLIFFLLLASSACRKSESSSSDSGSLDILGTSDQTKEAVELIDSANKDLKEIKDIYRENENGIQLLKDAMNEKDTEKVKKIADEMVDKINTGMNLGTEAVTKIEKVQDLNVNDTFKKYLRLKEETLKKQLQAFELRRQAGMKVRDAYGDKNKLKIDLAIAELREKEEEFKLLMADARNLSIEANQLYKESLQKTVE